MAPVFPRLKKLRTAGKLGFSFGLVSVYFRLKYYCCRATRSGFPKLSVRLLKILLLNTVLLSTEHLDNICTLSCTSIGQYTKTNQDSDSNPNSKVGSCGPKIRKLLLPKNVSERDTADLKCVVTTINPDKSPCTGYRSIFESSSKFCMSTNR